MLRKLRRPVFAAMRKKAARPVLPAMISLLSLSPLLGLSPLVESARAETLHTDTVKVTASRVERELLEVPMAVSVITKEDIKKSSARTVGDLLKDVPGVQVVNSGAQGIKRVSIRGEKPNRVLVLIDGQKIAENKSMDGAALLIDPSMVERVEVIKGPASVLYGSEAMGGVVNIITRKGGDKPIQGEAAVGYNGATGGFDESLSLFGGINGFKYRVSGSNTYQHNMYSPSGEVPHSKYMQQSASAFLSYDFSEHLTVGGSYEQFYSEIMAGDRSSPNFFVDISPWERQKGAVFAELKDVASFIPRIRLDGFWQKSTKNMHNHVEQAAGSGAMLMDNYAENFNEQLGGSIQVDWMLGDNHYLITGYDIQRDGLDATTNTMVSVQPSSRVSVFQNNRYNYEGEMLSHALFAQMESKLPWDFTLTYGARQTWVQSTMNKAQGNGITRTTITPPFGNPVISNSSGPIDAGAEGTSWDSHPVFNVGLMWTGIEDLSLRASFNQGFRVPSLQDKYVISSMGGGTIQPNPSLTPETSDTWELGARYAAHGWTLDATLFYSVAQDYIASQTLDKTNNISRYVNVNTARTHGVELAAAYELPWGLTPYGSLTWMRREFDYGDYTTWKSGAPEWSGRAGIRTLHALSDNVDLVGDVYTRFAGVSEEESGEWNDRSTVTTDGWATANASLGVRFGEEKQYSVMAEVLNIFNHEYSLAQDSAIVEPGVHVNLKVSVSF